MGTIVNTITSFLSLWLYSSQLFHLVITYWSWILLATLVLHIISFYFYAKYQGKKLEKQLNQQII